jgi:hypothetical protein
MEWPDGPALLAVLFDASGVEVLWSAHLPHDLAPTLEPACVRSFASARSMSRAFFPHWTPAYSSTDRVSTALTESVSCEQGAVLTAVPVPGSGSPGLLLGAFARAPSDVCPDMGALASALLAAASTCDGPDADHVASLDAFWKNRIASEAAQRRRDRAGDGTRRALLALHNLARAHRQEIQQQLLQRQRQQPPP